jgi:hypothetical protein
VGFPRHEVMWGGTNKPQLIAICIVNSGEIHRYVDEKMLLGDV